jgi:hypothetical protein
MNLKEKIILIQEARKTVKILIARQNELTSQNSKKFTGKKLLSNEEMDEMYRALKILVNNNVATDLEIDIFCSMVQLQARQMKMRC